MQKYEDKRSWIGQEKQTLGRGNYQKNIQQRYCMGEMMQNLRRNI